MSVNKAGSPEKPLQVASDEGQRSPSGFKEDLNAPDTTVAVEDDEQAPMIVPDPGLNTIQVRITMETSIFAFQGDEDFTFNASDSVERNLHVYLRHKLVLKRFYPMIVFRDRDGIILDKTKTLEENYIRDGDQIFLCTMRRNRVPIHKDPFIIIVAFFGAVIVGILLSFIIFICIPHHLNVNDKQNYGVIIDAGSVHTTVSVFEWPLQKMNGTGIVREAFVCESDSVNGISSFTSNPQGVQSYLSESQCLANAQKIVPQPLLSSTNVFLGATAGMRVLNFTNPVAARLIMGNISRALNDTELGKTKDNAVILSGEEEGVLGWISANYDKGVFTNNTTPFGALDWGGASSQITFSLDRPDERTRAINIFGRSYNVLTDTNLCYGQAEALNRYFVGLIFKAFNATKNISHVLDSPCQPRTENMETFKVRASELFNSPCTRYKNRLFQEALAKALAKEDPEQVFQFVGKSNHEECTQEIRKSFDEKHCQDTYEEENCFRAQHIQSLEPQTRFLAFSTYWYFVSFLKFPQSQLSETDFHSRVQLLCASSLSYAQRLLADKGDEAQHNTCFRGLFMHALLVDGYGFSLDSIGFVDSSWTTGYMLLKTNELPTVVVESIPDQPRCSAVMIINGVCLVILTVALVYLIYVTCDVRRDEDAISKLVVQYKMVQHA